MSKEQPKLDELMKTPQAAGLLKNKETVMGLMDSPDAQKLMAMLNQKGGTGLKTAADAAMKGDAGQLVELMQGIMQSKEGAELVQRINKAIPKK